MPHAQTLSRQQTNGKSAGFSLVEILIVLVAIGILSGLAITYVGSASDQSRMVVARQQQAQLQNALDSWIVAQTSGSSTVASAQGLYSSDAATMFGLISPYLRDPDIFYIDNGVCTDALKSLGKRLQFSGWDNSGYPSVQMVE